MKKLLNLNNLWSDALVNQLVDLGVEYVCISPGSRSTPLVSAFHNAEKIKKYVIIDERSSAFFALGIAKKTGRPVAVVTTSGTAVAELYPAIIEAYFSRTPLIILTADRPGYEHGCGANQTINQQNIFANHIRYFYDAGLPELQLEKFQEFRSKVFEAVKISAYSNKGPVHINLPFEKPLERTSLDCELDEDLINQFIAPHSFQIEELNEPEELSTVANQILNYRRGTIFCGIDNYSEEDFNRIIDLAEVSGYPILADVSSGLSFGRSENKEIISNHPLFLKDISITQKLQPELILQFGRASVNNSVLDFYKNSKCSKILVNKFGDLNDPSKTAEKIIKMKPANFCNEILQIIKEKEIEKNTGWLDEFIRLDEKTEKIKSNFLDETDLSFEGNTIQKIIANLPENCNLILGNSMPIRDFELFCGKVKKRINVFPNRGASGIDGLISTALGISAVSDSPTFLLIGDMSFIYDLNALVSAAMLKIPLNILLINNNGGHIFDMLPVSSDKEILPDYFTVPHNFNLAKIIKAAGAEYFSVDYPHDFEQIANVLPEDKKLSVFEFKTDGENSAKLRKQFFEILINGIE
ncbi:MAG: 2-succinyl-5-enolpyruvyl-6-hydroxy-3-cyclohexene-1-carboxylic-acid synthase [Ignavibacteria bacterium]|nr:2-succinyl-5-enolpyruvyl-6-hydroxy-3-cyclohexene-1-carboxylic-acid synthase [Ignavibacteria bacterium]